MNGQVQEIANNVLTPQEYQRYVQLSGTMAHRLLSGMVTAPNWQTMPETLKKQIFERVVRESRDGAKAQMFGEFPRLRQLPPNELLNELVGSGAR